MLCFKLLWFEGVSSLYPLFQAWTESRGDQNVSTGRDPGLWDLLATPFPSMVSIWWCLSLVVRQTPPGTGWAQTEASPVDPDPCELQYWGPGNACLLQAARPHRPTQRLQKRLSSALRLLVPNSDVTCPHLRRGEEAPLMCIPPHGNIEWERVIPQQMWQMFIIFILMKAVIFNCIATYLHCKLAKGLDKIKDYKWNNIERAFRTLRFLDKLGFNQNFFFQKELFSVFYCHLVDMIVLYFLDALGQPAVFEWPQKWYWEENRIWCYYAGSYQHRYFSFILFFRSLMYNCFLLKLTTGQQRKGQ